MIYRVHYHCGVENSQGYIYTGSKGKADALLAAWIAEDPEVRGNSSIDAAHTPKTKRDVIALLDRWGSHPNNG